MGIEMQEFGSPEHPATILSEWMIGRQGILLHTMANQVLIF